MESHRHPLQRKIDETKVSKSDMNSMIMDYLITECHPETAELFAKEAKFKIDHEEIASVYERLEIKQALYSGDITKVIGLINDMDYEILEEHPKLHTSLLNLQLIQLIHKIPQTPPGKARMDATTAAIDFATHNLAAKASVDPQIRDELEKTMTLLMFKPENWDEQKQMLSTNTPQQTPPRPLPPVIDPKRFQNCFEQWSQVLYARDRPRNLSLIRRLVRLRVWAEQQAKEKKMDLPLNMDLGLIPGETAGATGSSVDSAQAERLATTGAAAGGGHGVVSDGSASILG